MPTKRKREEPTVAPLIETHVVGDDCDPAHDEPTAAWQERPAETERTTGPGLTPPACPRCGADNNWLTINLSDAVNVYRCRCGGRLEVHA